MAVDDPQQWRIRELKGYGAADELEAIRERFENALRTAGHPADVALFVHRHGLAGITVYFSPMTAKHDNELLSWAEAFPSKERPKKSQVTLLVPHASEGSRQAAWKLVE